MAKPGAAIIQASWIGTAVFTATAIAAAIWPSPFVNVSVPVALVLFALGAAAFVPAFARAADRSRTEAIGIGGWFFLASSAPRPIQRSLMGSLALEVIVALATAAARPFTPLAFGILAPLYALSLAGLWGARHGRFGPRAPIAPPPPPIDQNAPHG